MSSIRKEEEKKQETKYKQKTKNTFSKMVSNKKNISFNNIIPIIYSLNKHESNQ